MTHVSDIRPGCASTESRPSRVVMGRFRMFMSDEDNMGEGTSSICRRGVNIETEEPVAIKVYKTKRTRRNSEEVMLMKFKRQIAVLEELRRPFVEPAEPDLWNEQLRRVEPSQLFMQLVDHSRDSAGLPGPDPEDGTMYVVTELAQYSLKDYTKLRRQEKNPLSRESVKSLAKSIITVTAGLHAKGFVHLDLKPENMMLFNGCLKLIDVDGCMKIGAEVSITDSSLSFSPCYCAPEWAGFLIEDSDNPRITISPALDVWSIGMTICELVLLDAALKPTYANFMRHGRSHREAGFHFMEWLSGLTAAPVPQAIGKFDRGLLGFLLECLLICDPSQRRSLASSMKHPYIARAALRKAKSIPFTFCVGEDENDEGLPREAPRFRKHRPEDDSEQCLHKGLLWKLNSGGNPKDPAHWLQRDTWITGNGSLCYFSKKEGKRLVLVDADHVSTADLAKFEGGAKEPAYTLRTKPDRDESEDDDHDSYTFACESPEDYAAWVQAIERVKADVVRTMRLGPSVAHDLRTFKLAVKNRRMKVNHDSRDQFDPVFKASLWKVKADGDCMQEGDWFEREMWISKNGSLVYWSKKEEKELVYYTHADIAHARLSALPLEKSCRPWAFQVLLADVNGMEFTPGCFAAQSEEERDRWISEFQKLATGDVLDSHGS